MKQLPPSRRRRRFPVEIQNQMCYNDEKRHAASGREQELNHELRNNKEL